MNLTEDAIKSAVRFIRYRPRSKKEVYDKLRRKGFNIEIIEEVISFLEKNSLLNDEEFARLWVNERLVLKKSSVIKIKMELRAKGISDDIIERVLSDIEVDEVENATNLLFQKFSKVNKKSLDRDKLLRKLLSNGFSYTTSEKAVNNFFEKF
ncbi:MAG: regulatory protein RecX [Brevinematia bacterium]